MAVAPEWLDWLYNAVSAALGALAVTLARILKRK